MLSHMEKIWEKAARPASLLFITTAINIWVKLSWHIFFPGLWDGSSMWWIQCPQIICYLADEWPWRWRERTERPAGECTKQKNSWSSWRKADVTWHNVGFWIRKILPRVFPEQKVTFKCGWSHWWIVLIFYKYLIVICRRSLRICRLSK